MNSPSDSADRPADELERIEIRPEMIEAGVRELARWIPSDDYSVVPGDLVESLYAAMTAAKAVGP